VRVCKNCELYYAHCPQTKPLESSELSRLLHGGHYVEGLGQFKDAYIARSKIPEIIERAHKGGVVTTLLVYMMDKGLIDATVVTRATEVWRHIPM